MHSHTPGTNAQHTPNTRGVLFTPSPGARRHRLYLRSKDRAIPRPTPTTSSTRPTTMHALTALSTPPYRWSRPFHTFAPPAPQPALSLATATFLLLLAGTYLATRTGDTLTRSPVRPGRCAPLAPYPATRAPASPIMTCLSHHGRRRHHRRHPCRHARPAARRRRRLPRTSSPAAA